MASSQPPHNPLAADSNDKQKQPERQRQWKRLSGVLPGRSRQSSVSSQTQTAPEHLSSVPVPPITLPPPAAQRSPRTDSFSDGAPSPTSPSTFPANGQQRSIKWATPIYFPRRRNEAVPSAFGGHSRNSSAGSAAEGSWRDRNNDHQQQSVESSRSRRQQMGGQRHPFTSPSGERQSRNKTHEAESSVNRPRSNSATSTHVNSAKSSAPRLSVDFTSSFNLTRVIEQLPFANLSTPPRTAPTDAIKEEPRETGNPPATTSLSPLSVSVAISSDVSDTTSQTTMEERSRCSSDCASSVSGPSSPPANASAGPEPGEPPTNQRRRKRGRRQAGGQRHPFVGDSSRAKLSAIGISVEPIAEMEDPREWKPGGGRHPTPLRLIPHSPTEASTSASGASIRSSGSDDHADPKLWVPGGGRHPMHRPSPQEVAKRVPQVPLQRLSLSVDERHRPGGDLYSAVLKSRTPRRRDLFPLRSPKRTNSALEVAPPPTVPPGGAAEAEAVQSDAEKATSQASSSSVLLEPCSPQPGSGDGQTDQPDGHKPLPAASDKKGKGKPLKLTPVVSSAPFTLPFTDSASPNGDVIEDGKSVRSTQSWLGEWQSFEIQNIMPSSPTSSSASSWNNVAPALLQNDSDLEEV